MTTLHTSSIHVAARDGLAAGAGWSRGDAGVGLRKQPLAAP